MFIVHTLSVAILFCVITMLGWGSWANTLKLAARKSWPFELFYWDYAIGIVLASSAFALTLGSSGEMGQASIANLSGATWAAIGAALLSGALFNLSNLLFVIAADAAGLAIVFPLAVGLALVIGTVASYIQRPAGNAVFLFAGVVCIVIAMMLSALASSKLSGDEHKQQTRGVIFAILSGLLMGSFYPQLSSAISPGFSSGVILPGKLTPYAAAAVFGIGLLISNVLYNTVIMRLRGLTYKQYFAVKPSVHTFGILGGAIWMTALVCNLIAAGTAGPAISYALGQGATLVGAIWGVFIWREFRGAPRAAYFILTGMFVSYAVGLLLVGIAAH